MDISCGASLAPLSRGQDAGSVGLTTGASAAGDHARARTNLCSTDRHRRSVPERGSGSIRPVGCIRLLGATPTRSGPWFGGTPAWASLVANDPGQGTQGLIYRTRSGENLGHIRLQDHNVAPGHPTGVRVSPALAEVVFRKDVVRVDPRVTLSGLLHNGGVRDESRSGR
jgi:hypothetical protein